MTETQPDPQVFRCPWCEGHPHPCMDRLRPSPMAATTQPDPQVGPDRRPHSRACGIRRHDHGPECHPNCPTCSATHEADIPAGQGPASLYIGSDHRGELAVMYRTGLDHDHVFMTEGRDDPTEARRALWDHLAATLPTVTREETQP